MKKCSKCKSSNLRNHIIKSGEPIYVLKLNNDCFNYEYTSEDDITMYHCYNCKDDWFENPLKNTKDCEIRTRVRKDSLLRITYQEKGVFEKEYYKPNNN